MTLGEIRRRVEEEADAYRLLEELRWPDGPICPHCEHDSAYFLEPANGKSRATGPKRTMSQRRVWKCARCRKQFSVLTGTVLHGTKVPIESWLTVMVQMCSAENGISAREVERMHDVTPETAWFMLHRLREAMKREPLASAVRGTIVSDETWVGGEPRNRHRHHPGEPDERVKLDMPAEEAIRLIMETGEHPDEDQARGEGPGPGERGVVADERRASAR